MNKLLIIMLLALTLAGCYEEPARDAPLEAPASSPQTPADSQQNTEKEAKPEYEAYSTQEGDAPSYDLDIRPPIAEQAEPPAADIKKPPLPEGFSYITDIHPGIRVDLRYAGMDNFTGSVVDGYSGQSAILSDEAARALSEVQDYLENDGLGLLVYDAYRPAKASAFFSDWAKNDDERMKERFYPEIDKSKLHSGGYIASRSGHSRGSTVDLTLVNLSDGGALDMGGEFDFFGELSWHSYTGLSAEQAQNRAKLRDAMQKFGFTPYSKEWWHYTLNNEPFPDEYFDFDVE